MIMLQIGAGLQITPNASRLLFEWGLEKVVQEPAAEPTFLAVRRYSDGMVLTMEKDFNVKMHAKYGAPFIDLHRVDLQKILYDKAVHIGVTVRLGARVVKIFPETSEVITESGEKYASDIIVGADGLWSRCREALLGRKDSPLPTGDLAYRIVLNLDQITDPELRDWISKPSCNFWIGPKARAVGYSVRAGTMYNLVLLCPDDLPKEVARQAGSVGEMRRLFAHWDPILTRFLDQVDTVDKWKLMYRSPLDSWTNEEGSFVLIGDSCHPMLPYLAQGVNSSIEDGGVLGRLLACLESKDQLRHRIKLYEQLRKARSEAIVRETFHQRDAFHLPDGPEQQERDRLFASMLGKEITCKFPSRWTCVEVQPWLYGYDAYKEADGALTAGAS
jgi:salicylate hydroxylase